MGQLNLGIPRRTDGQKRNWIFSDEEYLAAPVSVLQAMTDYEIKRNAVLAKRVEARLREAFSRLRQPSVWTWDEYRLAREVAYYEVEKRRLPLLPRAAIKWEHN